MFSCTAYPILRTRYRQADATTQCRRFLAVDPILYGCCYILSSDSNVHTSAPCFWLVDPLLQHSITETTPCSGISDIVSLLLNYYCGHHDQLEAAPVGLTGYEWHSRMSCMSGQEGVLLRVVKSRSDKRQVKCDRLSPSCGKCQELGLVCPGYDAQPMNPRAAAVIVDRLYHDAGLERRSGGACQHCRASKAKCDRARPSCRRCLDRHRNCTYDSATKGRAISWQKSPSAASIDLSTHW